MSEVIFKGTRNKGSVYFLIFKSDERIVEVPVEKNIADLVMVHVRRIAKPEPKQVERGNDEESA